MWELSQQLYGIKTLSSINIGPELLLLKADVSQRTRHVMIVESMLWPSRKMT